ncbi:hypothetical protein ACEYX6_07250 [Acinetobacter sp. c2-A9]|uniref:hypothetical protein n=1 Tax=Acinetobacter sp. c2-A9 TaxID=3342802 RepID=UPI0035BA80A9
MSRVGDLENYSELIHSNTAVMSRVGDLEKLTTVKIVKQIVMSRVGDLKFGVKSEMLWAIKKTHFSIK